MLTFLKGKYVKRLVVMFKQKKRIEVQTLYLKYPVHWLLLVFRSGSGDIGLLYICALSFPCPHIREVV